MDIKNILQKNNIDLNGKQIIVAVSGGPDSMCLLYLLNTLKDENDFKMDVCHVNYGLREKDSLDDKKRVEEICKKMSIKCHILDCNDLPNENSENKLRDIRYDFFKRIKDDIKADFVVVGHNMDDQVETILMNFMRGTSIKGLGGMRVKSGDIIRPLLDVSKKDVLKYLEKKNIPFGIDKTNLEAVYNRNRVRKKLIPLLEKEYNPNLKANLFRNSKIMRQSDEFIRNHAELFLSEICKLSDNKAEIQYKQWLLLPDIMKYETIKAIIEKLLGNLIDLEYCHIEEIVNMLTNSIPFGKKTVLKRLLVEEKYDKIELRIINKD